MNSQLLMENNACMDNYINPLTFINNFLSRFVVFPSEPKLCRVVPILKVGDPRALSYLSSSILFP